MEPAHAEECYFCGATGYLEEHHVFFGNPSKKKSEKAGLKAHICVSCHRLNKTGIHGGNTYLDTRIKREAQAIYEIHHSREEFWKVFGKYYLEEDNEMNRVIIMGRLVRDPEVRYSQGERSMAIARYTLAVDRKGIKSEGGNQTADFIKVVAFDKAGEFAEKYFRQGMRVLVSGRLQTGSYTNKDNQKVYTTDIIAEDQEFADSKGAADGSGAAGRNPENHIGDGFMHIPDGIEDEGLPFC